MISRLSSRPHATKAAHVAHRLSVSAIRAFHSSPLVRAIDMAKADTTKRLAELRKLMKERNVDVYSMARVHIVPACLTSE
jgi:Xaa-Pro aminopeptidase